MPSSLCHDPTNDRQDPQLCHNLQQPATVPEDTIVNISNPSKSRSLHNTDTMPFKEPNRRDSWPPTILRLNDDDISPEEIDANPFAYFLTSPIPEEEEDEFDGFEDLSAGIEAVNDPTSPIREVSPSSLQRAAMDTKDDSGLTKAFKPPLSLRDFALAYSTKKAESTALDIDQLHAHARRGRRTLRLAPPPSRSPRGRDHMRSFSAPRPRSWRPPSPDVWSIPEEKEGEEAEMSTRTDEDDNMPSLSDAYELDHKARRDLAAVLAEHEEAIIFTEPPTKKVKKKVHWAVLPTRDS